MTRTGEPDRRSGMSPRSRVLSTIAVSLALALVTGGGAWALWTNGGTGTGGASARVPDGITLTASALPTDLFPGSVAGMDVTMTNPEVTTAHIGSLVLDTTQGDAGFSVDAGHAACTTAVSDLTFVPDTTGWDVPGRSGGVDGTLTVTLPIGTLALGANSSNDCQGAQFSIYLAIGS